MEKCGMIIHPEDFEDLLSMTPAEAGNITQNAIKTFLGYEELVTFDDRFLSRVSRDVCSRIERDKKTYNNKAAAGRKGGKASAEKRQSSSKNEAKSKQSSSKIEADDKQTGKQSSSPIPKPIPIPIPKTNNISIVEEIVTYLNEKTGKHFQAKGETAKHINARLNDGYTVDDFKKVIDKKSRKWKDDPKMYQFLRPSTLFAPSHFDEYLNEPDEAPKEIIRNPKYISGENSLNPFNCFTQRPESEFDYDSLIKN